MSFRLKMQKTCAAEKMSILRAQNGSSLKKFYFLKLPQQFTAPGVLQEVFPKWKWYGESVWKFFDNLHKHFVHSFRNFRGEKDCRTLFRFRTCGDCL